MIFLLHKYTIKVKNNIRLKGTKNEVFKKIKDRKRRTRKQLNISSNGWRNKPVFSYNL